MVKKSKPVYYLLGEDDFQKEEFIKGLLGSSCSLDRRNLSFNLNIYSAKDTDIQSAIDTANTLPFLNQQRVVIINDIEHLKEDRLELLSRYCEAPNLNTTLILSSNKLDASFSARNEVCEVRKFKSLSHEELFIWIKDRLKKINITIDTDALELMAEFYQGNLRVISNEIEKLVAYIGKKSNINRGNVENLLGRSVEKSAFEFIDLIFREDIAGALSVLSSIGHQIEKAPPQLLGLILWNFKQVLTVRELLDKRKNDYEISRIVGMGRRRTNDFIRQAKKSTLNQMKGIFELLLEVDRDIKRSRLTPKTAYEFLSARLLSKELV